MEGDLMDLVQLYRWYTKRCIMKTFLLFKFSISPAPLVPAKPCSCWAILLHLWNWSASQSGSDLSLALEWKGSSHAAMHRWFLDVKMVTYAVWRGHHHLAGILNTVMIFFNWLGVFFWATPGSFPVQWLLLLAKSGSYEKHGGILGEGPCLGQCTKIEVVLELRATGI